MKIGIDLGGSHIAVGVITEDGRLLAKQEKNINFIDIEKNEIKDEIRDSMLSLINHVLRSIQIPSFVIEEIGIGVPGVVEDNYIRKIEKYNIYDWDLKKDLENYFDVPVKISNDALCSAKAEIKYGNLKDVNNGVFLCIGTGIGGVTILNHEIITSEFGHMIIQKEGKRCHCGRKGCFETYASMKCFKDGIIDLFNLNEETSSEEIHKLLIKEKDNIKIDEYIDSYIDNLIIGIANIINILNPEKICIGGGFTYYEDILYQRLLEKLLIINCQFDKPEIVLAKFKNDAGIIGATLD